MSSKWLDELNDDQRRAATHGDGPLLIIAGAGTGKTRTLVARLAFLLQRGVAPERVLLLTFARRAAAEMISRAGKLCGATSAGRVWGGTFHAVSNRLLRTYGRAVGLSPDFTVMDESDAADFMNLIRSELGYSKNNRRFPRKDTLAGMYSRTVNAQQPLREVVTRHFPWCSDALEGIAAICTAYAQRKLEQNVLDYDDLLLYWAALCDAPDAGVRLAERFDHILVDEYQDTNAIQAQILRGMRRKNANICVVGDDAQSIYSFRAATVRNILDFSTLFAGATTVTLEQNYRSLTPILAASNAVMEQAKERYTKNLWSTRKSDQKPALVLCSDESNQTDAVCTNILAHLERGVPLMKQAVLFRAGHHSAHLEVELARRNIPFHKYGGLKFLEAAHIKDLLALLRVVENPHDEVSWFRVLQLIEGVGPKSAQRIMNKLNVRRAGRGRGAPEASVPDGVADGRDRRASADPEGSALRTEFARAGFESETRTSGTRTSGDPVVRSSASRADGDGAHEEHRAENDAAPLTKVSLTGDSPLMRLFEASAAVPAGARESFDALREALAACCGIAIAPDRPARRDGKPTNSHRLDAELKKGETPPIAAQIERLRRFYQPILESRYDNATVRGRDLEVLESIAAGYKSRERFISELTLDPPSSTSDLAQPPHLDEDWLTLSTMHSAKGCEWTVVHVLHAADGMIPSDMAVGDEAGVDEERRLFYVAITRAKDALYVYFPFRYYYRKHALGDGHGYAQLTRFISPAVRGLFDEQRTLDAAATASESDMPEIGPAASAVQDRVRRLFQV